METPKLFEILKIAVAPVSAILIAIVGWTLTETYNSAQRDLTRTNAAMRYVEVVSSMTEEGEANQRLQADAIAAPVLPPYLAFRLAINGLSDNPDTLAILLQSYEDRAFTYLVRYLEVPVAKLNGAFVREKKKTTPDLKKSTKQAIDLLKYLRDRGHSKEMFDYLVSDDYTNERLRPVTLLLYFYQYRDSLGYVWGSIDKTRKTSTELRLEAELDSYLRMRTLSEHSKQAVAFAFSVVFGDERFSECDVFVRAAAERFWVNLDVRRFERPAEGSFQQLLYDQEFLNNNSCGEKAIELVSRELRETIIGLRIERFEYDELRRLIYVYAEPGKTVYLVPGDVVRVMKRILEWAHTPGRRRELWVMLGSFVGEDLFKEMVSSSDSGPLILGDEKRCKSAKDFAVMLLDWFEKHHVEDWPKYPGFFERVPSVFPSLEMRVNREKGRWDDGRARERREPFTLESCEKERAERLS